MAQLEQFTRTEKVASKNISRILDTSEKLCHCLGMQKIFVLTVNGSHAETTRAEFIAGLTARGASVEFAPSRLGNFEVVRVNKQPVARAFASKSELLNYLANN